MGLGHVADDGQAEAAAAGPAGPGLVDPVEALEDPRELAGRDALAGVGDLEDGPALGHVEPDTDGALGRRVAQGVVEQVGQQQAELGPVAAQGHLRLEFGLEPDPTLLGQVGVAVGDLLGQPDQVHRLDVEGATLDPGQVEQGPGQEVEALGLAPDPLGEAAPALGVVGQGGQQGLGQGPDRGHRRLQLVGGVGHEVAAQHLEAAPLGDVGQGDHDPPGGAAVDQREGPHGQGRGSGRTRVRLPATGAPAS